MSHPKYPTTLIHKITLPSNKIEFIELIICKISQLYLLSTNFKI
jgi:hypothetical protein